MAAPKKKTVFEDALKQLEQIAEQIEEGKIGLEESIARYEQGMELVRYCREVLSHAEQKIQQIQARSDGAQKVVTSDATAPDRGVSDP
jgi:exodeoxyribonuclease VII small subunit